MQKHTMIRSLVLASALLAPSLYAQSGTGTKFGVAIGGTASRAADLDVTSGDLFNGTGKITSRYGLHVGVYLTQPLSGNFSFQPELYYVQKGTNLDFGGTGQPVGTFKVALDYVEVPLLLRMDLGTASTLHPFVTAGPTIAMRVACKESVKSDVLNGSVNCEDIQDNGVKADPFEKTEIGANVGVGLEGNMGGRSALVQVRYGRGFTTLTKKSLTDQSPKHSVLSLILGLGF